MQVDKEFHKEVEDMFDKILTPSKKNKILVKNTKTGEILRDINYKLILFDSDMNIYKLQQGAYIPVFNDGFEACFVEE